MSDVAIQIDHVSKQYRLGKIGTGSLGHDLNRWWARVRGLPDPYEKVGQLNDRTQAATSDYVWALRDINFEVIRGDVVGVIGKNGAGKSTLLKLISQITSPTSGFIRARGRIASLLEVGTGMHPELTARENIYLNGSIMGMTRSEITKKLDDIVEFAGCRMYVDTPVKRYSSGMRVRLGFAVAAFLEPEILIVDEVLAVGDAEFQSKAIGKMQDVSRTSGRTILFVSHNLASVQALCRRGVVLANGGVVFDGESSAAVQYYRENSAGSAESRFIHSEGRHLGNSEITLLEVAVSSPESGPIDTQSGFDIGLRFRCSRSGINLDCTIEIVDQNDVVVVHEGTPVATKEEMCEGVYCVDATFPGLLLNSGVYKINLIFGENRKYVLFQSEAVVRFEVHQVSIGERHTRKPGILFGRVMKYQVRQEH